MWRNLWRDLLLLLLGVDIGIASPHLAYMVNCMLNGWWVKFMARLEIAGQALALEAVSAVIIILLLWWIGKKERTEREATTQRIIGAIIVASPKDENELRHLLCTKDLTNR